MQTIRSWSDLEPYGFVPLTGESCGLMYRILFDVTEKGRAILNKCLGQADLHLTDPWNRGSADDPHVGSVLLSPEMRIPLSVFALLESGCTEAWIVEDAVLGIEPADTTAFRAEARKRYTPSRVLRYAGTAGDRHVHVMSGRIT